MNKGCLEYTYTKFLNGGHFGKRCIILSPELLLGLNSKIPTYIHTWLTGPRRGFSGPVNGDTINETTTENKYNYSVRQLAISISTKKLNHGLPATTR